MKRTKQSIIDLENKRIAEDKNYLKRKGLKKLLDSYEIYNEGVKFYKDSCKKHGESLYIEMFNEGGYNGTAACLKCLEEIAILHKDIICKEYLNIEI